MKNAIIGKQLRNGPYSIAGRAGGSVVVGNTNYPCIVTEIRYDLPESEMVVVKTTAWDESLCVPYEKLFDPSRLQKVMPWSRYRQVALLAPMQCTDLTLTNHTYSIEPTLREAGLRIASTEFEQGRKPREQALALLPVPIESCDQVVYWQWEHPRGYTKEINVAWREIAATTRQTGDAEPRAGVGSSS